MEWIARYWLEALFGVVLAVFVLLCQLASMKSFGCDFLAPLAPHRPHNPDLLIRFPAFMQNRPQYFAQNSKSDIFRRNKWKKN